MSIALTILHIIVCFVLIGVILLQAGRGQGFGGSFGSGEGTQTIFGTRSADFLSRATSVCAILFLFTCIGLDIVETRKGRSLFESPALKSEDLEALQQALKDLEAKQVAETAVNADATQPAAEQAAPALESEVPSSAVAPESSAEVEAAATAK